MRETVVPYLKQLRETIIQAFQEFEPNHPFTRTPWDYQNGEGGGEIGLIRGEVFEKGAVNFSKVSGEAFPGSDGKNPFFATGVSLITHMKNPYAPTVHFNIRYIETPDKTWFGGGYDLTPMGFPNEEDTEHFHRVAKESLDRVNPLLYPQFSKAAAEYFYIPHRKKERGVGGIFFDHYKTDEDDQDFAMWKAVGDSFLDTVLPIYQKRYQTSYSQSDKELQTKYRAHYVEFNLLYDRGTKFGFQSGGNHEAILCSMPPSAAW